MRDPLRRRIGHSEAPIDIESRAIPDFGQDQAVTVAVSHELVMSQLMQNVLSRAIAIVVTVVLLQHHHCT
jgi:hypothetical protein